MTDYILPTSRKKIKYFRQLGNFLDKHPIVKLTDMRAVSKVTIHQKFDRFKIKNYFDIQRKCMSEGMSVFLPSSQDEIDEVIDIIPSTLKKEKDENNRTEIIEDIYSGLYIRMSDMVSKAFSLKVNNPIKFTVENFCTSMTYLGL